MRRGHNRQFDQISNMHTCTNLHIIHFQISSFLFHVFHFVLFIFFFLQFSPFFILDLCSLFVFSFLFCFFFYFTFLFHMCFLHFHFILSCTLSFLYISTYLMTFPLLCACLRFIFKFIFISQTSSFPQLSVHGVLSETLLLKSHGAQFRQGVEAYCPITKLSN